MIISLTNNTRIRRMKNITVPPQVVSEVLARSMRGAANSAVDQIIIQEAEKVGYTWGIGTDGSIAVIRQPIEGKFRQVKAPIPRAKLGELFSIVVSLMDTKPVDYLVHKSEYDVGRLRWAATLLSSRLHKTITKG
jgi:hypothetical protein